MDPLSYIHRASVFVAPILSGGGTKLKVLEAMAVGKAIVTTTIGCEGIDGISGYHYMVADEKHFFASAVVRLLNDIKLRTLLQANARKLVSEKYNYIEICKKLDRHFKMVMK